MSRRSAVIAGLDPAIPLRDALAYAPELGLWLKLPKGWKLQTRTLDADYTLTAEGTAYLVHDDLFNSYQRRGR